MKKTCQRCQKPFIVTDDDLTFIDQVSPVFNNIKYPIPTPKLCPECRLQRRLAFRCQTALFKRQSFPTGKKIIAMHPASAPFPVMSNADWFTDKWDALYYGQNYSFDKSFIEQFRELNAKTPKYARIDLRTENSEYCNNISDCKNCYLVFSTSNAEDSMYCESAWGSKDCIDCTLTLQSELCYDCTNCINCYNVQNSEHSENCVDSHFLAFCRSCANCFGCVNLRNKQYCVWNEQKTKEEYEAFIKDFNGSSFAQREIVTKQFEEMMLLYPRPHAIMRKTEECSGNFLEQCKNVTDSAFIQYGENLKYCLNLYDSSHDCRDLSFIGRNTEWMYECATCGINSSHLLFSLQCRDSANLLYCYQCDGCQDCFGCIGLWKKRHCIFNKQYSQKEYESLAPKIIEHMQSTDGWGEFFPMQLSPMPYNRSIAQRYFPLTKAQALAENLSWHEEDEKEFPGEIINADELPDGLPSNNNPLTIRSALSNQPFQIIPEEIKKYRSLRTPLPRLTYYERMEIRAKKLGGLRLYEKTCAKTGKRISTTYPPESPYTIWDRDEYEKEFN